MRKIVPMEHLNSIFEANEKTKGSSEYGKYTMCLECKFQKDNKWTGWKYMAWTIPNVTGSYYYKEVKGKMYMMRDLDSAVERFEVTQNIRDLLNIKEDI